jgi:hypothetical protein
VGLRFTARCHARRDASSHYAVLTSSVTAPRPTHSLLTSNAKNRTSRLPPDLNHQHRRSSTATTGEPCHTSKDNYRKHRSSALPEDVFLFNDLPPSATLLLHLYNPGEGHWVLVIWLFDPLQRRNEVEVAPVHQARYMLLALAELAAQRPSIGMAQFQ